MNLDLDLTNNQTNTKSLSELADKSELGNNEAKKSKARQNPSKPDSQQDSYDVSIFIKILV